MHRLIFLFLMLPFLPALGQDAGQARLKDLVTVEGAAPLQLIGYGLVVGLDRTGDRAQGQRGSPYTVQSIANMLRRFGITVDPNLLRARNAAAVMVTATLDPFAAPGSRLDVTVSALGDARSLSGGVLLQTPLQDPTTGQVYVIAQGPLSTSAVLAASFGSSVQINHTNTGRVPGGGVVTATPPVTLSGPQLGLVLKRPDFTNAIRIAEVINSRYPNAAEVVHAGLIRVNLPNTLDNPAQLLAELEPLTIDVDLPARVIINERTGTIVAGGNVRISEVMITYGSLIIATQAEPFVAQPPPYSQGETVTGARATIDVQEEVARSVVLGPNADVAQLATALNELGLTARDIIAIFQAIERAGALQGELIIL